MPKKSIKEQLQSEIEIATEEVKEARAKVAYWQSRLTDSENELERLQGALDALEGKFEQPMRVFPGAPFHAKNQVSTPYVDLAPKEIEINGEKVILEPGFKVAKNSRGEDCIVPEGLEIQPMEEPEKPGPAAFSLPPVTDEDEFQSPESLL